MAYYALKSQKVSICFAQLFVLTGSLCMGELIESIDNISARISILNQEKRLFSWPIELLKA